MKEKLILIDGNSLINRAFYAMPLLTTKNGDYTNAVYGFMNMLFKALSDEKPDYVAVAFDLKAPTFRHKIFAQYKGTRKPMPEELRPQIPLLKEVLKIMGIAVLDKEGFEADDIIGTVAKKSGVYTLIYTGDRDAFQLVDDKISVCFTKRGISDLDVYTGDNFKEKTGITPLQIIDLKSLMGDASDNIPGVKGVGEKTALGLIKDYGSLEGVYSHLADIKGALNEKLCADKEQAFLSKTLATIDLNAPVEFTLDDFKYEFPFPLKVKEKFGLLEFKTLVKKEGFFADFSSEVSENNRTEDQKDGGLKEPDVTEIKSVEELARVKVDVDKLLSVVIYPDGVNMYAAGGNEIKIAFTRDLLGLGISESDALKFIKTFAEDDKRRLLLFNVKDFRHYVKKYGDFDLIASAEDLSLIKYLADYNGGREDLSGVLAEYGLPVGKPAFSCLKLYYDLKEKLAREGMEKLYREVELPLSKVLFDMEEAGFKVDVNALQAAGEKYSVFLKDEEKAIRDLAGEQTLNVNSPKQLGEVLFEKLKIGKGKKTKTGYSTSADVLENLDGAHPIVEKILNYRRIQKLQSTYIDGFKPLIDKKTGLIHTSFNQTVTATGRLSSKEPNLQNIPVRDEEGKELRKFFVPKRDYLVGADYSQIELRLLAAFSGCKKLIDAFNAEKDVHSETASKVFGVPIEKVTPSMRRDAKAVNFGIIYGISEYGLAKNLKISDFKARDYIRSYFNEFPEVKAYMNENVRFATENGYAVTLLGRKRYIRELQSANRNLVQFGERVAMNMPLQGSAADIIKVAMINVASKLKRENLKSELILQIHDELIIDTDKDELEEVGRILKEEMENAVSLPVRLSVDLGIGKTWFEAK